MRSYIKIALVFSLVLLTTVSFAQKKQKLGHINSSELLKVMPGKDTAEAQFKLYASNIQKQLESMKVELDKKYKEYTELPAETSTLIKQAKEQELVDLQGRIEAFQTSAQEDLAKKEQELLGPIIDKATKAIEDVARENGYTYVIDESMGTLLFADPTDDIMPLVKAKLGIK